MRRTTSAITILLFVAGLIAVWWIDRGRDHGPKPIDPVPAPAPGDGPRPLPAPTAPPAPPPPIDSPEIADIDLSWITDAAERAEVVRVATAIDRGGPFAYRKDGAVFANREGRLPKRPPGYWREYTVPTPGERDRGARRLVAGQRREIYYTRDHYRSFIAIRGATP